MNKNVIVVVAYNRPRSLERILNILSKSYYSENVDLIISIDRSEIYTQLKDIGDNFNWAYGDKNVIVREKRLGLRKHILACGDLVANYKGLIMFEDDIVPSKYFYHYSRLALDFYQDDKNIGGISLYSPDINEMVEKPFIPLKNEYSVFFMQSASSWGQAWTKDMWLNFREWYNKNNKPLKSQGDMPEKIYSWPETSWKKYYMKYLVVNNKYFVYPFDSLSTNFNDVGQHAKFESAMYQVPLVTSKLYYNFPNFVNGVKYDSFYENQDLEILLEGEYLKSEICVDIYGTKKYFNKYQYLLTTNSYNLALAHQYGLSYKPHELNILMDNPGNEIKLYKLQDDKKLNDSKLKQSPSFETIIYYSNLNWKDALYIGIKGFSKTFKRKLKEMVNFK
ncbi:hypothetical protein IRB23M11_21020 [Alkalibacterium sp. m-11]|uniref:GNT-I family protein n=1 Tax=Alkalibacterium indicireducens TaxID=398758 RepID=A0ABP3KFL2_9LACT